MNKQKEGEKPILAFFVGNSPEKILLKLLEENNFKISFYSDYEEVISELSNHTPDILITSISIGQKNGWQLCQLIKNQDDFDFPVVILGEGNEEKELIQLKLSEADGYAPRDFSQNNIVQNIIKTYSVFQKKKPSRTIIFSGNLNHIHLSEIVQSLHNYASTGCLYVHRNALCAKIFFRDGHIYHANVMSFKGSGVFYYVLSWEKGTFKFSKNEEVEEINVTEDLSSLLFEAMRIIDEVNRVKQLLLVKPLSEYLVLEVLLLNKIIPVEVVFELVEDINQQQDVSLIQYLINKNLVAEYQIKNVKDILENLHTLSHETKAIYRTTKVQSSYLEESLLQRLIFSLSLLSIEQVDLCLKEKSIASDSPKILSEIIVDKGYLDSETIENLLLFKDVEGESLIRGYTILNKLAEGSRSIVYKGKKDSSGDYVAIKIFIPQWEGGSDTIQRLMREAEISSKLSHPLLIKTHDFGENNGFYYLVSEFVDGKSLGEYVVNQEVFNVEECLSIANKIARALIYIWEKGYIHRDIKPSNILYFDQQIKVCDFGLAKNINEEEQENAITSHGVIVGTPGYIAPECYKNQIANFQTDIYSLGMTLYALVMGRNVNDTDKDIEKNLTKNKLPKEFIQLIKKITDVDPQVRALDENEILIDIERAQLGKSPRRYKIQKIKSSRLYIAKIAVVALLSFIAVYFFVQNKEKKNVQKLINNYVSQSKECQKKSEQAIKDDQIEHSFELFKQSEFFAQRAKELGVDFEISHEKQIQFWINAAQDYINKEVPDIQSTSVLCKKILTLNISQAQQRTIQQIQKEISNKKLEMERQRKLKIYNLKFLKAWLSTSQNKKVPEKTVFENTDKIYLHYVFEVINCENSYPINMKYNCNDKKYNKQIFVLEKNAIEHHVLELSPNTKEEFTKGEFQVCCTIESMRFKWEKHIPFSVHTPRQKILVWTKKTKLFPDNYLQRLQGWNILKGNWAPAEDHKGVYGVGTGQISHDLKKYPWRIIGNLSFNLKNKEAGVIIQSNNKIVFVSIQPIHQKEVLVTIGESTSFNTLLEGNRKIIYSTICKVTNKNINYKIVFAKKTLLLGVDKLKPTSINNPDENFQKFILFTKNAQAVYFDQIKLQYAKTKYK